MSALLAMVACSKDEVFDAPMVAVDAPVITASFEQSRVSIADNGGTLEMSWAADDELSVFMGTGNMQYSHKGAGEFEPKSGEQGSALSVDANYAVYPYASGVAIAADGTLSLTMPAEQSYAVKSFGAGANTMVAATASKSATEYNFKNVGGYLRLKLYGNNVTVKSIEFKGNHNEPLAGAATVVAATDAAPALTWGATPGKTITLDCGAGVELGTTKAEATEFWFVVPETEFEDGFTVTITDTDGDKMVKSTTKPFETVRNYIKTMEAFQVVPEVGGEVIFDAQFNADGSATDKGKYGMTIAKVTDGTGNTPDLYVVNNPAYTYNNIARFTHAGTNSYFTHSFYMVDYQSETDFQNNLADGFAMEIVSSLTVQNADAWARPVSTESFGLLRKGANFGFSMEMSLGTPAMPGEDSGERYAGLTYFGNTTMSNIGEMYHYIYMYDDDAQKVYLYSNGEKIYEEDAPAFTIGSRLAIGGFPVNTTTIHQPYTGDIAMVRIYDDVMTAAAIEKRYKSLTLPKQNVTIPTPLFDAKFGEDMAATNVGSQNDITITAVRNDEYLKTVNIPGFGYVARCSRPVSNNEFHDGYFMADYRENTAFKNKLTDGFTMEALVCDKEYAGDFWVKPFGSDAFLFYHTAYDGGILRSYRCGYNCGGGWVYDSGIFAAGAPDYDYLNANDKVCRHLVFVYDHANKWIDFFVNGCLAGRAYPAAEELPLKPGSVLGIGAFKFTEGTTAVQAFVGDVAIARIYDEVFDHEKVGARFLQLSDAIEAIEAAQ